MKSWVGIEVRESRMYFVWCESVVHVCGNVLPRVVVD